MGSIGDYWIAATLTQFFYVITMVVYNRARKEYEGGKIGTAIKLILGFLAILLLSDTVDYFLALILSSGPDTVFILKILLKLTALCVLFFGGIKFFDRQPVSPAASHLSLDPQPYPPATGPPLPPHAAVPDSASSMDQGDAGLVLAPVEAQKSTLGRYEILEQIGQGAMGVVYKALDPKLKRTIAVKTIRFPEDVSDDDVGRIREQFYREATVVAKLSHQNIVAVYDVGEDSDLDLTYLAMEYLEGESLEPYIRPDHLLPMEQCIDVVCQVCDALDYAHDHGIVHRDIKPANIVLLKDGRVKVADFGVAHVALSSRTQTGTIKGTPYYMSPEQTKGLKVTGASDIFSLGVVFYQFLTGKLPFYGENLSAIMHQITTTDPPPPATYNPDVSEAVAAIVSRALEKDLSARYATARQMGDDLQRLSGKKFEKDDSLPTDGLPPLSVPLEALEAEPAMRARKSDTIRGLVERGILSDPRPVSDPMAADPEAKNEPLEADEKPMREESKGELQGPPPDKNRIFISAVTAVLLNRRRLLVIGGTLVCMAAGLVYGYLQGLLPGMSSSRTAGGKFTGVKSQKLLESEAQVRLAIEAAKKKKEQERQALLKTEKKKERVRLETARTKGEKGVNQEALRTVTEKVAAPDPTRIDAEKGRAQARIEAEKRAEQARARIEAENRAKQERARIEAEKSAEQERARIEAEKSAEQEQARIKAEKQAVLRQAALKKVLALISKAQKLRDRGNYAQAGDVYASALKMVQAGPYRQEEAFAGVRYRIQTELASDDMVYSAKGYIKYQNAWLSPGDYEARLRSDGYVRYQGRFVHYKDLAAVADRLTQPAVNAYLSNRYAKEVTYKKQTRFQGVRLGENTSGAVHLIVAHEWEVWTFQHIGRGSCSVEIAYFADEDQWRIIKGCR